MLKLKCTAQNYAWGRPAEESEVASLHAASGGDVDADKRYAELWMGSHPSGPSHLSGTRTALLAWLKKHPECLGDTAHTTFGTDLPFLFKVLSVDTALSIQSHPDKALAQKLHAERPNVYKDPNHKPEMALALTPFEAMSCFKSDADLIQMFKSVPEMAQCIVPDDIKAFCATPSRDALKSVFKQLMTSSPEAYSGAVGALVARLGSGERTAADGLALHLAGQYPGDVGVLASYFLNHITLAPGEAVALPANEPHAYVSGQCVECMATSDNVVRAGLTPKLRDTEVLCESLTYSQGVPEVLRGEAVGKYSRVYRPPFEEFEVLHSALPEGAATLLRASQGPMLVLVQHGSASFNAMGGAMDGHSDLLSRGTASRGDVLFLPAGAVVELRASRGELRVWGATVNRALYPEAAPLADDAMVAATPPALPKARTSGGIVHDVAVRRPIAAEAAN